MNGWVIGMGPRKSSGKGLTVFIHKENEYKKVPKDTVQEYIKCGWTLGGPAKDSIHIIHPDGGHKMIHENELHKYINSGWKVMKNKK